MPINSSEPVAYTDEVRQEDVLLGKGRDCTGCVGTIAFKALLEARMGLYLNPKTSYSEKTHLSLEVLASVTETGGRFLLKSKKHAASDSTVWEVLDKNRARTKIRDCLRDCVKQRVSQKKAPSVLLIRAGMSQKATHLQSYSEILELVKDSPLAKNYVKSQRKARMLQQQAGGNDVETLLLKAVSASQQEVRLTSSGIPSGCAALKDVMMHNSSAILRDIAPRTAPGAFDSENLASDTNRLTETIAMSAQNNGRPFPLLMPPRLSWSSTTTCCKNAITDDPLRMLSRVDEVLQGLGLVATATDGLVSSPSQAFDSWCGWTENAEWEDDLIGRVGDADEDYSIVSIDDDLWLDDVSPLSMAV